MESSVFDRRAHLDLAMLLDKVRSSPPLEDLDVAQDHWEQELDVMGAGASREELLEHLMKAPDSTSPLAQELFVHLFGG